MADEKPRLPNSRERLAVIGRTGSGKTLAALWHLSQQSINTMPWVIYDFKGDEHIEAIPRATPIELGYVPKPKETGIFVVRPSRHKQDEIEEHLWGLWEREDVGIYIDEGYMIDPGSEAFKHVLTQGRSKRIPAIILSQRPAWVSRYAFSEANFFQVFDVNDERDEDTIRKFAKVGEFKILPDYYSRYYDVQRKTSWTFSPVPSESEIMEKIEQKTRPPEPPKRRLI
jgi:hypothetical protein